MTHKIGLKKKTIEVKAFGYPINKNNQTTIASLMFFNDLNDNTKYL